MFYVAKAQFEIIHGVVVPGVSKDSVWISITALGSGERGIDIVMLCIVGGNLC